MLFLQGLPNGVGVMRFPDSSRYEGECMQGWFHGHGVFQTIGGMKFEGIVFIKLVVVVISGRTYRRILQAQKKYPVFYI